VLLIAFTLLRQFFVPSTSASWYDDAWTYRKRINIPSHTGSENNVYVTVPSFDATDTSKFQSDCGNLRFTKENGQLLPFYDVDCDATTTYNNFAGGPIATSGIEQILVQAQAGKGGGVVGWAIGSGMLTLVNAQVGALVLAFGM
jgi:hypothetical protein